MTDPSGILSPPTQLHIDHTANWIILGVMVVLCVPALAYGIHVTRRDRSPLFFLMTLGSVTFWPFFVEPIGDVLGATWYPADSPLNLATILGHHISLLVVVGYLGYIAPASYLAYRLIIDGTAAKKMILVLAGLACFEVPCEMIGSHFGVINYYGNEALILGVPIYSMVQNGFMFAVIGVALAAIVPHMRGWRWLVMPYFPAAVFVCYAIATTLPAYYAINEQFSPLAFWATALLSAGLNLLVAIAALYSPTAERYREHAAAQRTPPVTSPSGDRVAVAVA